MNAHTTITPEGNIPIPADVIERLGLKPGMDIVIDEAVGVVRLKQNLGVFRPDLPRTTIDDIMAFPKWEGEPKTVEEIRLDDETLRRIFEERNREDSGY